MALISHLDLFLLVAQIIGPETPIEKNARTILEAVIIDLPTYGGDRAVPKKITVRSLQVELALNYLDIMAALRLLQVTKAVSIRDAHGHVFDASVPTGLASSPDGDSARTSLMNRAEKSLITLTEGFELGLSKFVDEELPVNLNTFLSMGKSDA